MQTHALTLEAWAVRALDHLPETAQDRAWWLLERLDKQFQALLDDPDLAADDRLFRFVATEEELATALAKANPAQLTATPAAAHPNRRPYRRRYRQGRPTELTPERRQWLERLRLAASTVFDQPLEQVAAPPYLRPPLAPALRQARLALVGVVLDGFGWSEILAAKALGCWPPTIGKHERRHRRSLWNEPDYADRYRQLLDQVRSLGVPVALAAFPEQR